MPTLTPDDRVLGKADAPITIFEFFSLTCPHCAEFLRTNFPQAQGGMARRRPGQLVYRDFPLDRNALKAALVARCGLPERYPAFVETLFQQQAVWVQLSDPTPALRRIARLGGIGDDQFDKCLSDDALSKSIVAGEYQAQNSYGVDSTPTFFVSTARKWSAPCLMRICRRNSAKRPARPCLDQSGARRRINHANPTIIEHKYRAFRRSFASAASSLSSIQPSLSSNQGMTGIVRAQWLRQIQFGRGAAMGDGRDLRQTHARRRDGRRHLRRHRRTAVAQCRRSRLALDNAEHNAPKPYDEVSEIEIVRRIERGTGSDYRINGREVRARDVQLLFADAATGAHSAALVFQGRIGAIINAKPIERRSLLEEAAGISGLHSRRHEAELRLKAAETNLTRLDGRAARARNPARWFAQATRQASRYRRLSDHIRRAEAVLLHLRWQHVVAEHEAAAARLRGTPRSRSPTVRRSALAAERNREDFATTLPGLRHTEASTSAELQRLVLARQALEDEEHRIAAAREAAEARLQQVGADLAREEELAADARAALARLDGEGDALRAAQTEESAAQDEAATALSAVTEEVALH